MFRGSDEESPSGAGEHVDELNARYGEYIRRVRAYVRWHHPDVSAEDVTQDTLERLWRNRTGIDQTRPIEPYLFAIANNVARDVRRGRRSESRAPLYLLGPSETEAPDERALRTVDHGLVHEVLDALEPSDRHLMRLRYWRRLSCRDVGKLLRITDTAARRRLSRAQRRCRYHFKRLSPVLIPLWAAFHALQRELRRIPSLVPAAGTIGVLALAVGIGTGFVTPEGDPGAGPVIPAPKPAFTSGSATSDDTPRPPPARMERPSAPSSQPERQRHDVRAPSDSVDLPLPGRRELYVSPNTGDGRKQAHLLEFDTPVGPVTVEGERNANGRATADFVCTDLPSACPQPQEITTDGAP